MGNRPSTANVAAATGNQITSSTHRSAASAGVHQFRIEGHSVIARSDEPITSKPFRVGGYDWTIRYYPNGADADADDGGQHVSVLLSQNNPGDGAVTATYSFSCLQDNPASPTATEEKNKVCYTSNFSSRKSEWGPVKFMSKEDLAASGCLKDDCLVIKCAVEVITKELTDEGQEYSAAVVVPPSDLTQHLGSLLASGHATDITVEIGDAKKLFKTHRCVLAARSPVLRTLLCGKRSSVCIKDVDAGVFEILLHYMYHDDLPVRMREACSKDTIDMAQRVIAAAGRYGMDRLKLMCESKLSKSLDVDTVCSILDFADRHDCTQLKTCCLEYMLKDQKRLKDIANTQGFKKLNQNCLSIACEMLLKAL